MNGTPSSEMCSGPSSVPAASYPNASDADRRVHSATPRGTNDSFPEVDDEWHTRRSVAVSRTRKPLVERVDAGHVDGGEVVRGELPEPVRQPSVLLVDEPAERVRLVDVRGVQQARTVGQRVEPIHAVSLCQSIEQLDLRAQRLEPGPDCRELQLPDLVVRYGEHRSRRPEQGSGIVGEELGIVGEHVCVPWFGSRRLPVSLPVCATHSDGGGSCVRDRLASVRSPWGALVG